MALTEQEFYELNVLEGMAEEKLSTSELARRQELRGRNDGEGGFFRETEQQQPEDQTVVEQPVQETPSIEQMADQQPQDQVMTTENFQG